MCVIDTRIGLYIGIKLLLNSQFLCECKHKYINWYAHVLAVMIRTGIYPIKMIRACMSLINSFMYWKCQWVFLVSMCHTIRIKVPICQKKENKSFKYIKRFLLKTE
jgi:hypothetical protein